MTISSASALLQPLQIHSSRRYLATADEQPFFWLADTAWELLHRLDMSQTEQYLRMRVQQGFNVIQTVLLAERDGLFTPAANGRLPLLLDEQGQPHPLQPDTLGDHSYWHHVDNVLELAQSLGLYIALLPAWGDKFNLAGGIGPEILQPDNAYHYGHWLAERYSHYPHIVWVLGGDRALENEHHLDIIRQLARGIRTGSSEQRLLTFHPKGGVSSSRYVHDEAWLDLHMIQSSHGAGVRDNYRLVEHDYALQPVRPTLDAEPCYEDIPIDFEPANGYFDEADVRQAAYYAVFSGACGHTYGHHSVWSMYAGRSDAAWDDVAAGFFIMTWQQALDRPGAKQMQHMRALMESVDFAAAMPARMLLEQPLSGANTAVALYGKTFMFIYCPTGLYVKVRLGQIEGVVLEVAWYCPRTGRYRDAGTVNNTGIGVWEAPSSGRGQDWVLCLFSEHS
ncbi:glycoside hydrolase family 140 protein [Paenibacillus campi]|uniref:glycoside hydrolase family 140 protein n=1 Tax=Paenibacillus campi TaxID=3106031 RepID=UPI002B003710|nr:glycoside hydrolase family 140 protein [Paenibacillus sp. SGZ-1014]